MTVEFLKKKEHLRSWQVLDPIYWGTDFSVRIGNVLISAVYFDNETASGFVIKVNAPQIVYPSNNAIKSFVVSVTLGE